jgi:hypothetical protein
LIHCIFAYQGGQQFGCEYKDPRDALIAKYATIKAVDARLTLIIRMQQ